MSATSLLVDDHLLLRTLLDDVPPTLGPLNAAIFTTGLWYHRLCRALADQTVVGALSASLGGLDDDARRTVIGSVIELPESIGLISLRTLGWAMADLIASGVRLNLMSLEALAAAEHLGAAICMAAADVNPPLRAAAAERGVTVHVVGDD